MANNDILNAVRKELTSLVDEKNKDRYKRFFKEDVKFYGVGNALVEKLAAAYFKQVKPLGKKEAFRSL